MFMITIFSILQFTAFLKFFIFFEKVMLYVSVYLRCDWLLRRFLHCDWMSKGVKLQKLNSSLKSVINYEIIALGTNQNAGIASIIK